MRIGREVAVPVGGTRHEAVGVIGERARRGGGRRCRGMAYLRHFRHALQRGERVGVRRAQGIGGAAAVGIIVGDRVRLALRDPPSELVKARPYASYVHVA
jgi:hypothetical protein